MVEELPPSAMVVAKSTEDRILLQALLRIHHVPVVGEGDGAAQALKTLRERRLTHLVVDSDLADGTVAQLVRDALSIAPGLRIVVLGRSSLHTPDLPEGTAGSVVWLTRPFRFSQFAEALASSERCTQLSRSHGRWNRFHPPHDRCNPDSSTARRSGMMDSLCPRRPHGTGDLSMSGRGEVPRPGGLASGAKSAT